MAFKTVAELRRRGYIPQSEAEKLFGLPPGELISWDYIEAEQWGADDQKWVLPLRQYRKEKPARPARRAAESKSPNSKIEKRKSLWMTQEEAAEYLGIHRGTLYRYMRDGIVQCTNTRPRLVNREDVERRAGENWYSELECYQERRRRPKLRPYRRDGAPLVSDEQFRLCEPYGTWR